MGINLPQKPAKPFLSIYPKDTPSYHKGKTEQVIFRTKYLYENACTYIHHVYIYICMHVQICTNMYICTNMDTYIYVYICIYAIIV